MVISRTGDAPAGFRLLAIVNVPPAPGAVAEAECEKRSINGPSTGERDYRVWISCMISL